MTAIFDNQLKKILWLLLNRNKKELVSVLSILYGHSCRRENTMGINHEEYSTVRV